MMKATAWFCPVLLTLLCATRLVCTAQRGAGAAGGAAGGSGAAAGGAELGGSGRTNGYPLDYPDGTRNTQDDFLLAKRNKPSLSIVNPLDVLRQRLLLEIARRQMKENSRQVELNRAILKNVGKRFMLRGGGGVGGEGGSGAGGLAPKVSRRYRQQWPLERELEQERQRDAVPEEQLYRQQLLPWKHFPSQLWSYGWTQSPYKESSQFVDSQQSASTGPQSQALPKQLQLQLLSYAKKPLDVAGMGLARHRVSGNANEANETNHENDDGNGASKNPARYVDDDDEGEDSYNDVGAEGVGQGLGLGLGMGLGLGLERFEVLEDKPNWANEEPNEVMMVNANDRVPWSFPYRFHKSQHNVN